MGYIGNEPTTGHFPVQTNLVGPGPTYPLTQAPATAGAIEVSVSGVLQPTTAYSVVGTTLTMAGVGAGIPIFIRYLGETLSLPTPADGSVTDAKMASSGTMPAWNGSALTGITHTPGTNSVDSDAYVDGSIDAEHFSSGARNTISLDGSPDTNNTATGPQTNTFASGYTASITDLVVIGNASKWIEADADNTATSIGLLGIALEAKNDTQLMNVALSGSFIRGDGWSWTPGAPLYIGNTLGAMVEAKPTGTGDIVRTVGYAVTPTVIFFTPSSDYVTLV